MRRKALKFFLQELHWLPVRYRIHFKNLLLTSKALNGMTPAYISDLINVRKRTRYSLCSINSGTLLLHPAGKMKKSFGDRSFSVSAPTLWNALQLACGILVLFLFLNLVLKHIFLN